MRRLLTTAAAAAVVAVVAVPAAAQGAQPSARAQAKPALVRVQILTRFQEAVARKGRVRARVAFKGRGVVRIGGRLLTTENGRRRAPRLLFAPRAAAPPPRHAHGGPHAHEARPRSPSPHA